MNNPGHISQFELHEGDVREVLEVIKDFYGFDLFSYNQVSLMRRLSRLMSLYNLATPFELKHAIVNQSIEYQTVVNELTVNVTEMFRHPQFFKTLREEVVPYLKTFPEFNIWHAGCSTGEEAYSLAIVLYEEGILNRANIYGTDINTEALAAARKGIYDAALIPEFTKNYYESGGERPFSEYYTANYGHFKMLPELAQRITFHNHNLLHDGVFNDFQLILNRNVLIYFNRATQSRVTKLFEDSLTTYGYLALGSRDPLMLDMCEYKYEELGNRSRIFKKIPK